MKVAEFRRNLALLDAEIEASGGYDADDLVDGYRAEPDGIVLVRGDEIEPVPVEWLWREWLAMGKTHLLAGAPGQGKTTIAMSMAATVSSGGCWPNGAICSAGNVLIWSAEDDFADTLLPRLIRMGADRRRVFFIKGVRLDGELATFNPARDMAGLTATARAIGNVKLLIVDPVVSAVAGDSHNNGDVRKALQPIVDLASNLHCAAIGITHLSKGTAGRDPVERVTGSIAFTAVVRVVMVAAKVEGEDGDRRILVRSKSNLGPDDGGFEYSMEMGETLPGIEAASILWGNAITGSARDLLAVASAGPDGEKSAVASAELFLRELLTVTTGQKFVQSEAKEAGHAWATVRRAAEALGVIMKKGPSGWYWQLPQLPA